jgi:hypothetical protein
MIDARAIRQRWEADGSKRDERGRRLFAASEVRAARWGDAIAVAKRMIWWFYGSLKEYKLAPTPQQAEVLRARFDRIFKRGATGYVMLDRLLRRLFRHKDALLRVLDRPEIPLNTNASENDIRAFVTKRKISGGTVSDRGRDARDIMLGLAKTCMKLKLSFYDFLGSRIGLPGTQIPPLAKLIRQPRPNATQSPGNLPRLPKNANKLLI